MEAQHLDIGDRQSRRLDLGHDLRKCRNIAAGEDVFVEPGRGEAGCRRAADGVKHHDAVILQQLRAFAEEGPVGRQADMLEHADGDDPVEAARQAAIVPECELHFRRRPCDPFGHAPQGVFMLLLGERYAKDIAARRVLGQMQRETTPAATDVENAVVRLDQELGGEVPLLGQLRVFKRLIGMLEIGAGILPVRVEEQLVQPPVEIVMMRDIGLRASRQVAMTEDPQLRSDMVDDTGDERMRAVLCLPQQHRHEIVERAMFDKEAAVHVKLAKPCIGIDQKGPLRAIVGKADADRLAGTVAECQRPSTRRHHDQRSPRHDARKRALQAPVRKAECHCILTTVFRWQSGHYRSSPLWGRSEPRFVCQSPPLVASLEAPAISQTPVRIRPLPITCRPTTGSPKTSQPVAMIST